MSSSSAAIRSTPSPIRCRHLGDQLLEILRNPSTSPAAGFPSPEKAEAVAVPPHKRVWLDDREDATPVKEPGEHNEGNTRGVVGPSCLHLTLYVQRQLLAQEEILGGQAGVGPKTEGDQARDISDESENGAAHDGLVMIASIKCGLVRVDEFRTAA